MPDVDSTNTQAGERGVFRIALSMSGAISAGAYTAGVFDFLIQALAELERARLRGDADLGYDIRIVAMSGASAGGITAAIGTVALGYTSASDLVPRAMPASDGGAIACVLPKLYEAWVIKPRMVGARPGDPGLLSTEDLRSGNLVSLLNCKVLDGIRDAAFIPPASPPAAGSEPKSAPYSFFAEPLHVYLTVSNLAGVPYEVKGADSPDVYRMVNHADRLHFKVSGLGADTKSASDWAGLDTGTAMTVSDLIATGGQSILWQQLGAGALATAAFPVGLEARVLDATRADYSGRWFPAPAFIGADINPCWPDAYVDPYRSVAVDGGVMNNDPFEFARYALLDNWQVPGALNPRCPDEADRAVIMISPFPEGSTAPAVPDIDNGLIRIASLLLPALIQQARFKVDELAAAVDPNIASRLLVAPRRTANLAENPSSANIACGALGGFGGFLDQRFREHDFQLGRRNCQQFLRDWKESKFTYAAGQSILPLFGAVAEDIPEPAWPSMNRSDYRSLIKHIGARADAMVTALLKRHVRWWPWRAAINAAWRFHFKNVLMGKIECALMTDLTQRKQIAPD